MSEPLVLISVPRLEPLEGQIKAMGARMGRAWDLSEADRLAARAIINIGAIELAPEFLESLPALGLIAAVSVGYDGIDVPALRARGVEVTHARGLNADDVADHALGLLIGAWRDLSSGERELRAGAWTPTSLSPRPSLKGRKVGIVGLGAIGRAVAVRAEAFGMIAAWWGPRPKDVTWPRAGNLLDLARDSDILVVACRADAHNQGLISREVIEAVGPQGLIVNVARGSLIDEDALIAALRDGRLGRAGLDVFETEPTPPSRWADVPGTFLTPHTAGASTDAIPLMVAQAVENVRRYLAGEPLLSPVA